MTGPARSPSNAGPRSRFLVGFLLVALVIAGGLSYLASPEPDGLDSVTLNGCAVTADEQLAGTCIAQDATGHGLADGPLADYAVGGRDGTTGIAGVVGVLVTAGVALLLFRLLRGSPSPGNTSRRDTSRRSGDGPGAYGRSRS